MLVEYQICRYKECGWVVKRLGQALEYRQLFIDAVELANSLAQQETTQGSDKIKVIISSDDCRNSQRPRPIKTHD